MAIPPKKFQKLLDLEAQHISSLSAETLVEVEKFKDDIGWPWKASKEQIDYWNEWYSQHLG